MNVLDLFSGIGGFSLGLERAGMRTVAFCEIDKFCKRVLSERWPENATWPGIDALNALLRRALKSSPRGSPVRISHTLEKVPALPEPVQDSSGAYFEPFAWYDHDARCWRTFQRCLVDGNAVVPQIPEIIGRAIMRASTFASQQCPTGEN